MDLMTSSLLAKRRGACKGPHGPDAIWQRDANFQFSKLSKTEHEKKFCKICRPTSLNC